LREHDVPKGIGPVVFGGDVDDLYLEVWYFLHAEDVVGRDFQYHLAPQVLELPPQRVVLQNQTRKIPPEEDLRSVAMDCYGGVEELQGIFKRRTLLDLRRGYVHVFSVVLAGAKVLHGR